MAKSKLSAVLLALIISLSLIGCGNTTKTANPDSVITNTNQIEESTDKNDENPSYGDKGYDEKKVLSVFTSPETVAVLKNDSSLWILTKEYIEKNERSGSYREVFVKKLEDVKYVDIYKNAVAAITKNGEIWLYGSNNYGITEPSSTDNQGDDEQSFVKIMDDAILVELSETNIGIVKSDGSLWIGGSNVYGQIGNGNSEPTASEPIQRVLDDVKDIKFGDGNAVALKNDGSVWTWGSNLSASLGNGTNGDNGIHSNPTKILEGAKAIHVAGLWGFQKTLVIKTDNSLWAWGGALDGVDEYPDNYFSNGTDFWDRATQTTPLKIMENVAQIGSTVYHNVPTITIITTGNELYLWGHLISGEEKQTFIEPTKVMDDVQNVDVHGGYIAAVQTNGSLWFRGEINRGAYKSQEQFTEIGKDVESVYAYKETKLYALKVDGNLYWWIGGDTFGSELF